jgi:transposase-like protein
MKGLERKPNNYLPPEEKERIIRLHEEKGVSLRSIFTDYDISPTVFKNLLNQVRKLGYSSLYERKTRGRPRKVTMARPKKKEPQTELERLQAENLRLRAENALLKKVKALVEEQQARARLNGQKPSTN